MRRKRLMLITTIFAVFAMTSYAFAANQGFVNVTSEPVAQGTSCAKAGGFSIAFDSGTTLTAGDQITIDLDLGVTLCKDIDLLIAPFASANGSGWGKGTIPTSGSPVVAPNGNLTSVDSGVVFLVTGNSGSARITVDVMGPDANGDGTFGDDEAGDPTPNSVTVTGGTADDKLIINFLDQHTNSVDFTTQEGIWSNTKKDDYREAATLSQNTICIDVSTFTGTTVKGNMDSKGDVFTFIPSNPQIAHIVTAAQYELVSCKSRNTGTIKIGSTELQSTATCSAFDNEAGSSYCTDHAKNNLIIHSKNGAFGQVKYDLEIEILVNDTSGDNGVYFSNDPLTAEGYTKEEDACSGTGAALSASAKYFDSSNSSVTPAKAISNDCDNIDSKNRAVKLKVSQDTLNLGSTNDYLYIDLPAFNYDLDKVAVGDVVSVKITLSETPCTLLKSDKWVLGTFGSCGSVNLMLYPYFTAPASTDAYWDGIVITNIGPTDGTAKITAYEKDTNGVAGDVATFTVDVKANSMFVSLLSNINWTQTSGSGTFGDTQVYIVVTTDFTADAVNGFSTDGFAMIARTATGESMGYLPRLPILQQIAELQK